MTDDFTTPNTNTTAPLNDGIPNNIEWGEHSRRTNTEIKR